MLLPMLLLLALVIWAVPAGAARAHSKLSPKNECPPAHMRPIAADTQAEIYVRPEHTSLAEVYFPEEIVGCVYAGKRAYSLGEPPHVASSGSGGIRLETLNGTMTAYERGSGGPGGASWIVEVRNLATGELVHRVPSGTPAHPAPPETKGGLTRRDIGIGPVESLVVKSDGAVAWIAQDAVGGFSPYSYQVHALDKTGSRVLAVGPEIEPHSLALAGSTLYWLQGGKPMSARLN